MPGGIPASDLRGKLLRANGFHAPVAGGLDQLDDVLIDIDGDGWIAGLHRTGSPTYADMLAAARRDGRLVSLPAGALLLPGFVDLHIHAPQYPQLGSALDVPLEVWLHKYTFPLEARYADAAFARRAYGVLVRDLLANGTTTALYFATQHLKATEVLVDCCLSAGQRALVGKVVMDAPDACPDYYRDPSPEAALRDTEALIQYVQRHPGNADGVVRPVVTPRFIPSCTDAALEGLGEIARRCNCHVQTHCSESDWEHGHVLGRHGMTDAESLDRFGLVGRRTVLAHANFLTAANMELLAARGAAVAHCPLSNAYFAGAVFQLRAALAKGVRVGLGTDISGGPSASLFDAARASVMVSRMLESGVDPDLPAGRRGRGSGRIDMRLAFHLATAGGADALDLPVGRFEPGCLFDAMVIDCGAENGGIRIWDAPEDGDRLLERVLHGANRANIARVFVGGRPVAGASPA